MVFCAHVVCHSITPPHNICTCGHNVHNKTQTQTVHSFDRSSNVLAANTYTYVHLFRIAYEQNARTIAALRLCNIQIAYLCTITNEYQESESRRRQVVCVQCAMRRACAHAATCELVESIHDFSEASIGVQCTPRMWSVGWMENV